MGTQQEAGGTPEFRRGRHCGEASGITGPRRAAPVPPREGATSAQREPPDAARASAAVRSSAGAPPRVLASGGEARIERRGEDEVVRVQTVGEAPSVPAAWDHPHLVGIRGLEGGDPARLRLEAAPGGSAAALMRARGVLPPGEAVTLLVPLARALAHLHEAGVSHGDVAPDNVLFRADGAPVLADPGLVRSPGEAPRAGGTPGFTAPEGEAGTAGDVYAWGALAWYLMTGAPPQPWASRTPLPLAVPGTSGALASLLDECLEADPRLRPRAAELPALLLEAQAALPLDATRAVPAEGVPLMRTVRPGPRERRAMWRSRLTPFGARAVRPRGHGDEAKARIVRVPRVRRGGRVAPGGRVAWAGALLGVVVLAGLGWGVWRADGTDERAGTAAAPMSVTQAAQDRPGAAAAALPALDRARTAALSALDVAALSEVYAEGSPARSADAATVAAMLRDGRRFDGLGSRLESVQAVGEDGGDVTVAGWAVTSSHTVTGARDVEVPEGRAHLEWRMHRGPRGWRIVSVAPRAAG